MIKRNRRMAVLMAITLLAAIAIHYFSQGDMDKVSMREPTISPWVALVELPSIDTIQ